MTTINAWPSAQKDISQQISDTITAHENDPHNLDGIYYGGKNVPMLIAAALEKGYKSQQWGTYLQCQTHGLQVRKGERGTSITFAKYDEGETVYRSYRVFNVEQCDPIQEGGSK